MLKNSFKKNGGFTLVEMLVSIAVFMVVMTIAVGSLVSIVDANRKAQAIKNVINNINFAIESISKDMRMGKNYSCYDGTDYVGDCLTGGNQIRYKNKENKWVHYRYVDTSVILSDIGNEDAGNIQKCVKDDEGDSCSSSWQSITAPTYNVNITNMRFYVTGTALSDSEQPKVVIVLEGVAGTKKEIKTDFNMQTSISQRMKDI